MGPDEQGRRRASMIPSPVPGEGGPKGRVRVKSRIQTQILGCTLTLPPRCGGSLPLPGRERGTGGAHCFTSETTAHDQPVPPGAAPRHHRHLPRHERGGHQPGLVGQPVGSGGGRLPDHAQQPAL
ncbi:protein of unknown function [Azospirillum baldaniorum]|uniref:Uncharacterized protein n=1 Tax=Azospirillum baldaniorum TaxID=1064539 RepID=A0A9P1JPW6_9PROT|nr:protein of unknown function [Azospirillum baldaniorum]